MTDTPIADAAWIDVTITRLFAPLWQQLGPLCSACGCLAHYQGGESRG